MRAPRAQEWTTAAGKPKCLFVTVTLTGTGFVTVTLTGTGVRGVLALPGLAGRLLAKVPLG